MLTARKQNAPFGGIGFGILVLEFNMSISMSLEYLLLYLPLLIAVSFVMGATRHEKPQLIFLQTQRTAVWITTFMLVIYAVLQVVSWLV